MKKLFVSTFLLVAAAVGVAVLAPKSAHAISVPAAQQTTIAANWESLGVAAGAAIASPVLKLENATECAVAADNSAGGATRALNIDFIGLDGTTILYRQAITVAIAGRELVGIGSVSQTASLPTGVVVIPVGTMRRMQFTLAAGGAAAGSLSVVCR